MAGNRTGPIYTSLAEYRIFLVTLGSIMKRWRRIRRMSQRGLAQRVGVTDVFIRYIESSRRGVTLRVAVNIARALDIPVGTLCPMLRVKNAARKAAKKKTVEIPMRSAVVRERAEAARRKSAAA